MLWFCLLIPVGLVSSQSNQYNNLTNNGNLPSNPCTDKNHMFLIPGVLTAGSSNRACISRFYPEGPARLLLTLLTEDKQTLMASKELSPGDGGCLDINVPQIPNSKADLIVNLRYPLVQCSWERRMSVRISSGRVVVITTERARYRPGDTVRLRVLALKQDLAPSLGLIEEVWLEGPSGAWEGTRVTQWLRVRTRLGLAHLQYQLEELAPTGKWTLRARLGDGSQGTAVFWVGNYELPPFQLAVRHAARVLKTSERLAWTVCVRYPWSEAVEGMLVIRIRGAGGGSGIRTAVRLRAPKACHRHAAAARRVGMGQDNPPDVIVADFSFQEEGTRIWQNTTVVSQVVDKRVSLEFLTKHRAVISPGLPCKLKVKATRWDEKPAAGELVKVCRYPWTGPSGEAVPNPDKSGALCVEGTTDSTGVARLLFAAGDHDTPFYRFEACLSNESSTCAPPLALPLQRAAGAHAALGPLRAGPRHHKAYVPLYLRAGGGSPYTVHFVVITRGGIIYHWGATTQCPTTTSADQIVTAPRNSKCDANNVQRDVVMAQRDKPDANKTPQKFTRSINGPLNDNKVADNKGQSNFSMAQTDGSLLNVTNDVLDALLDRHQLRVLLPIRMSHQMCPDSHLIAYFYHNGELVSASKHFEMDECFDNKVEIKWANRQALPGSKVTLHISSPGPALCALTVLDAAARWARPPASGKEQLMGGLRRLIDSHRNLTEYDAAGDCFLNVDTPETPLSSMELTSSWLAAGGVRLLGGEVLPSGRCQPRPPALLISDDATVPRSDFSEAWLWRLVAVSAAGAASAQAQAPDSVSRFEASAVCVSRNWVAVAAPAVLQVFREFFIHADSPKRLRRGDTSIIRYRIFNYLYEPLSVQIQILTDPHMEGPKDLVETACVGARSSIARRAEVRARVAAPARVSIRAKAVSDGNCGNVTSGRTGVSDEVIIRIDVDPEGIPIREQKSILLCGNGTTDGSGSEVSWDWPPVKAVLGTETLTVWAVGDVTGPLLADADSLLMIPRGCGEQNMAQLATNLLALQHLEPTSIAALTARDHVARGFNRQLQYVHPSGGFSAFGSSDATSSTWLTAFVIRHLRKAHKLLWPNLPMPPTIIRAERWLLNQQMENGCFRNEGQVFHRELRGGLNDEGEIVSVALTAYVITSLIESASPLPYRVIRNTLSCLRAFPPLKSKSHTRVYAHALLAYAYMRLKDYEQYLMKTNDASSMKTIAWELEQDEGIRQLLELLKVARRSEGYVWWEASSLSTSIEATAYAMLALHKAPAGLRARSGAGDAGGAARWLAAHRGAGGGFVSTQDTLVALEALTAWSSNSSNTHLNVTASCGEQVQTVTLLPGVKIPDVMRMKPGDRLNVSVEGTGCALIQATRAYNSLTPEASPSEKPLSVQVSVTTDGPFNCDANGTSCFCAAVIEACVMWSGSFPEMALLEVSLPGGFGVDAQLLYSQLNKGDSLLRRIELAAGSSRATLYLSGGARAGEAGHSCWRLHAAGPRARTRPAAARLHDYYVPAHNDTQVYTIPEDCPPRIAQESNQYHASDNLYTKARALDTGEILVNREFSFEDIPEGIPLEDPLYDNLTRKEKDKIIIGAFDAIGRLAKHDEESNLYLSSVRDENGFERFVSEHDDLGRTYVNGNEEEDIADNNENITYIKEHVSDNIEVSTNNKEEPINNHENVNDNKENVKENHENITDRNDNIPNNNDNSDNNENITYNKEVSVEVNDNISDNAEIIAEARADNVRDESKYDTRNNIVQEIDTLNKVAHKQFNETQAKFDLNIMDTKNIYADDEDDSETNIYRHNQNSDNSIDDHSNTEELKTRENEIKRSYSVKEESKPQLTEKELTKTETHLKIENDKRVDNPNLGAFHVIDSEKDLEVPSGVEGPIPTMVLPPPDFVAPMAAPVDSRRLQYQHMNTQTYINNPRARVSLPDFGFPPQSYLPLPVPRGPRRPQKIPSDRNLLDMVGPLSEVFLPPFNFNTPISSADYRNRDNVYMANQSPPSFEGPISNVVVPPPGFAAQRMPDADLKSLQSVYTAHGPYYYYKEDDSTLSKRLFIPIG